MRWSQSGRRACSSAGLNNPFCWRSAFLTNSASINFAADLSLLSGTLRVTPSPSVYLPYHLAAGLRYFFPSAVRGYTALPTRTCGLPFCVTISGLAGKATE